MQGGGARSRVYLNVERAYREFRNEMADAPWDTAKTFDAVYSVAKAKGIEVEVLGQPDHAKAQDIRMKPIGFVAGDPSPRFGIVVGDHAVAFSVLLTRSGTLHPHLSDSKAYLANLPDSEGSAGTAGLGRTASGRSNYRKTTGPVCTRFGCSSRSRLRRCSTSA